MGKGLPLTIQTSAERARRTRKATEVVRKALAKGGLTTTLKERTRTTIYHNAQRAKLRPIVRDMAAGAGARFRRRYRDLWAAQDEFARTSFVEQLRTRLGSLSLSAAEWDSLEDTIASLSAFRFPTRWSGFKFKSGSGWNIGGNTEMQHPTSPSTGIWVPSVHGFSGPHSALDNARIDAVVDAVNALATHTGTATVLKPGVTLDDVARTIVVTSGTFTFRLFTAPAEADNVAATGSAKVKRAQTRTREFMKDRLVDLGAKRASLPISIPKLNLPEREWRPDLIQPGEISPRRGTVVTEIEANTHWNVT